MVFARTDANEKQTDKIYFDDDLSTLAYGIHKTIEKKYSTPRRYLVFLDTYKQVYRTKQTAIVQRQQHLKSGVSKLSDARQVVDNLKRNAEGKQRELAVKQREADDALKQITKSMTVRARRLLPVEPRIVHDQCVVLMFRMLAHKRTKWNN
jgi:dynein heavy chain 2, cytosolic